MIFEERGISQIQKVKKSLHCNKNKNIPIEHEKHQQKLIEKDLTGFRDGEQNKEKEKRTNDSS